MMGELTKVLIKNHHNHIRLLKDELNQLYANDKKNGTNSKEEAEKILSDITEHRELIKALQAGKQD